MFFRQYHLECLSLFSYLIGDPSTGRAVVVDPQRDIGEYLADAEEHGLSIERILETHFHADFLSGHLELAEATGAAISYGPGAQADFPIAVLADGERLSLGQVELEILHTPGHTPESMCIVVRETPIDEPWAVLTGDTLFIGDVGRPDLLTSIGRSAEELGLMLYESLHNKLMPLPDSTLVYPGHGAGSACGKQLSTATSSTIGEQRENNYALASMDAQHFIEVVTQGQSVAPLYFAYAADTNRRIHALLDDTAAPPTIDLAAAIAERDRGAILIDTRSPEIFASGHVRGSINVGLDGRFAEYSGDVIEPGEQVVLLTEPGQATEAKVRLARIGFDKVIGAVEDIEAEILAHPDLAEKAQRLPAHDLADWIHDGTPLQIVDIRNPSEVTTTGSVPGAVNLPLAHLMNTMQQLDPTMPTVVYCAGGYRSSIAASALRSRGFATVADLVGGFGAWELAHANR